MNLTTQLLEILLPAYNANGLNNTAHLQVINQTAMNAKDESSFESLIIGFNTYEDSPEAAQIAAAEYVSKEANSFLTPLIQEKLKNFPGAYITTKQTGDMTIHTAFQNKTQAIIYATILCTDETVYITITEYPQ